LLPGLGVTATATLLPVANEWQVSLLYESTRRDFNLGGISTPYIANTRDMNLLGGKTGGRFPVKKKAKKPYMHLILRAHTHTSMRVLLRHSRQILIHRRLFDASSDSDIPKNVPFTFVINTLLNPSAIVWECRECGARVRESIAHGPSRRGCDETEPRWLLRALSDVWSTTAAWDFLIKVVVLREQTGLILCLSPFGTSVPHISRSYLQISV
jgi:hypothetical protein